MASGWVQLRVEIPPPRSDLVAGHLWAAGCAGIEERDLDGRCVLLAGFEDRGAAEGALARLAAAGWHDVRVVEIDDDGLDAWREWATAERAGPFTVCPTWVEPPPLGAGELLLAIDPGRSFGSGSHPTTRLVLAELATDRGVRPGDRVLDVGCGSGVLAIASALLGADRIVGIDVDPDAPDVTRANARRNGAAHLVEATGRPLAEIAEREAPFDLVTANLLAPIVAELAGDLVRLTRDRLIVSGLLAGRWEETAERLSPLVVIHVAEAQGWVSVSLRRPER